MKTRLSLPELARRYLAKEPHALDPEERNVLVALDQHRPISRDAADLEEEQAGVGDRLADRVAAVGGSWGFIMAFMAVLAGWIFINSGLPDRLHLRFDPYPYIFLNLMLSMLAAVQAPIIMMSQNRQGDRDRVAASHDYEVNLRAELEIMRLHEKLDALIARLDREEPSPLVL
jgi:uncharacterized membrane protein